MAFLFKEAPIGIMNLVVMDALRQVRHVGQRALLGREIRLLGDVFSKPPLRKVFMYRGSLTTPPCSENVLWVVSSDASSNPISPEQLSLFRAVENGDGIAPYDNWRHLQSLGDREVKGNFQ